MYAFELKKMGTFTFIILGHRPTDFVAEQHTEGQKKKNKSYMKTQAEADLTGKLLFFISNTPSKSTLTPMLW